MHWIFIGILVVILVLLMIVNVLSERRHLKEVKDLNDRNDYLQRENDSLNDHIAELNIKFSGSLDTREKNYNDIYMDLKKLQIELDKKDTEIEKLKSRVAVIELPVDIAKITEVKPNEKEETEEKD